MTNDKPKQAPREWLCKDMHGNLVGTIDKAAYDSALAEKDAEIARLREALKQCRLAVKDVLTPNNLIAREVDETCYEALSQTAAKGEGK